MNENFAALAAAMEQHVELAAGATARKLDAYFQYEMGRGLAILDESTAMARAAFE